MMSHKRSGVGADPRVGSWRGGQSACVSAPDRGAGSCEAVAVPGGRRHRFSAVPGATYIPML